MYVRLAFSIAAHVEPELLLVDEVLVVGDAAFQRKCIQRIKDLKKKEYYQKPSQLKKERKKEWERQKRRTKRLMA